MKQTLTTFPLEPLTYPNMGTPKVRMWADVQFQASTGEVHPVGNEKENYREITLTGSGSDWVFPTTGDIDSTDDSDEPNATYTAAVVNATGKVLYYLFEQWAFPASLGTLVSYLQLSAANVDRAPLRDDQVYSKTQIDLLLAALGVTSDGLMTAGYIPKLFDSSTLTNSVMREADGLIGIGASPTSSLYDIQAGPNAFFVADATTESLHAGLIARAANGIEAGLVVSAAGGGFQLSVAGHSTQSKNFISFATEDTTSQYFPEERMRITHTGNVGIGTSSPAASALLDLTSTTKTLLTPRMTTAQKNAVSSPQNGSIVYDTTLGRHEAYRGGAWGAFGDFSGIASTPFFTTTATNASGQTFTQIDQTGGADANMYASWLHQTTNVLHADQVGFVSKIVAGADVEASRPVGHPAPGFKAGAIFEGRTTAGVATDFSVWGSAHVASSESGHTGRAIGIEVNNNQGSIASPSTTYTTNLLNTRHQIGVMVLAGGNYQGHVGIEVDSVGSSNRWIRAFSAPFHGWTNRAFEAGDATDPINAAQSGIIAVMGISTASSYLARAPSDGLGNALRLVNYSQSTDLAKVQNDGVFWSGVGFRAQGTAVFEIYKDATPTKGAAVGLQVPGSALGNDVVISGYTGAAWQEKARWVDGTSQLVLHNQASLYTGAGGSLGLGGNSFGSGQGVFFVANAGTNPSTNPSSGALIYADGGVVKFRSSGGIVMNFTQQTAIVDADGTLADITTKFNSLLTKLETIALLAT